MSTKVWEFLLPDSGQHQVLVERLGQSDQRWYIDGVAQPSNSVCEGPGGCILELRRCRSTHAWQLLVNGMIVEDYSGGRRASGDCTLRGLREMPEGSYMIAPQVEAVGLHGDVVKEFVFLAYDQKHAVQVVLSASNSIVQVGHPQAAWEIIFDGHVVARHTGDERGTNAEVSFSVSFDGVGSMTALLKITWVKWPVPMHYRYNLSLEGVDVPAFTGQVSPPGRMLSIQGVPGRDDNIPVVLASVGERPAPAVFVSGVEREYLVDNRSLRSVRQGLGYRSMKDVNMRTEEHEPWGTIVTGIAEDDGWLKVGQCYLPILIDGLPVLTLLQSDPHRDGCSESPDMSTKATLEGVAPDAVVVDVPTLPQGVSFNRDTGRYRATIKSKTGRWVDLGEHNTPEEAHQKYLEAMPIHNPNKVLAPSVSPFDSH